MIRVLTEGVRRMELIQLELPDLSSDSDRAAVRPGSPAEERSRLQRGPHRPAGPGDVPVAWRPTCGCGAPHRQAASPALWLGTRNRGPLTGSGLYRMLKRRAEQAGYEPDVHPHQFRHTFANDWLAGDGSEGDLMRLMGWTDRSMLDLYAEDMQMQRAIQAKRRRGDLY